jgi:hypothetical protein
MVKVRPLKPMPVHRGDLTSAFGSNYVARMMRGVAVLAPAIGG